MWQNAFDKRKLKETTPTKKCQKMPRTKGLKKQFHQAVSRHGFFSAANRCCPPLRAVVSLVLVTWQCCTACRMTPPDPSQRMYYCNYITMESFTFFAASFPNYFHFRCLVSGCFHRKRWSASSARPDQFHLCITAPLLRIGVPQWLCRPSLNVKARVVAGSINSNNSNAYARLERPFVHFIRRNRSGIV